MAHIRPETMWACVSGQGYIDTTTIRRTRSQAITAFMQEAAKPWAWWRRHHGWRCVRVVVMAAEGGA